MAPKLPADQKDPTGIGNLHGKSFFSDTLLNALINTALQNNPDLKMAAQRIEMAHSGVLFAPGELLPNVDGEISGGGGKFGDYTMDSVGNFDAHFSENLKNYRKLPSLFMPDYFGGLRSSQEIDIVSKLKSKKKAAYNRLPSTGKVKYAVITGLIAQVATEHYQSRLEVPALNNWKCALSGSDNRSAQCFRS